MTRPFIVRADTIDLQDAKSPSAKDHSYNRQQGNDDTAPHQANTLREVAHQAAEDESRSPRLSWSEGNDSHDPEDLAAGVQRRMQHQDDSQQQQHHEQQEQQQLSNAHNGSGASSSDEEGDDGDMDDDMLDRISSSPSIDDEDIDFEFVYALHTFVATVEGQANATKGDTMVLLDDSNSYWWLVRIVKDSSIGYLPAEHIETPTERLARRNKYRNVDLSATMLSDNAPKQKTSFKGIRMRRKTVTFTEPTYVDYTEIDYSSDEEDIEELFGQNLAAQAQAEQQQKQQAASQKADEDEIAEESAKVEPLKTRSENTDTATKQEPFEEETRDSEEIVDGRSDGVRRTRNGTVRTTDSFFKDETVETKKITLTPNLLRDDNSSRPSTDSIGSKGRISLESKMERELVADKDKKNKKDKKPSAIRSFFSRKDKKRTTDDDDESFGKRSMDIISEPRDSEDPGLAEQQRQSPEKASPARSSSKLQKQHPKADAALSRKDSKQGKSQGLAGHLAEGRNNDVSYVPPASMRIVDPETRETREVSSSQIHTQDINMDRPGPAPSSLPKAPEPGITPRPQPTVQADSRMDLDDSDSDEAEALLQTAQFAPEPQTEKRGEDKMLRPQLPGAFPDSFQTTSTVSSDQTVRPAEQDRERLSESPVHVSPIVSHNTQHPPELMADNAHEASSPEDSPTPYFATVDESSKEKDQPQWDDSKLRAFFDDGDHVRDLLTVVYDTSDVDPSDSSASGLFREQNARLAEITTQLDNMLGDWLARKQRSRGTV